MKKLPALLLALGTAGLLAGCGGDDPAPPPPGPASTNVAVTAGTNTVVDPAPAATGTAARVTPPEVDPPVTNTAVTPAVEPPAPAGTGEPGEADWIGWGGSLDRNMVDTRNKNLPVTWDVENKVNVKWMVELGSQSYGNPSISKGLVLVGTNNEGHKDPELVEDMGNILCLRESDGKFLWQAAHDKLSAGRVNDWPLQGICSAPWIEGDRFWYFNNRAEVVCADLQGFLDGENDGMQDEQYKGETKADIIWMYDTIEELGNFPHNLATSSPLVWKDFVYVVTGNGVDEGHLNLPSPLSPSFIALDKNTGALAWEFAIEGNVLHGQWSSPTMGEVDGKMQSFWPGGDGVLYSLDPTNGELIWKFDLNPPDSKWELGGYGTRNNLISTPVFHEGHVYLGVGQDPEHGTGIGHFFKIDASGKGDVTKTHAKWHRGNEDFGRTMSTAAVYNGLVFISDLEGYLYCLDADTGDLKWKHDAQAAIWGSAMVADGKVYLGDEDGEIVVLEAAAEKKVLGEVELDSSVYTTAVPANGCLYIVTKSKLYCIEVK